MKYITSGIILAISCLLVSGFTAEAVTPLTSCAHSDDVAYNAYVKGTKLKMMGDYTAATGFSLGSVGEYLIAPQKIGKVTFKLGGKYNKLTFMMGPMVNTRVSSQPSIVTVRADGKKLVDEKIYDFDIPRSFEVNVAGAQEVTFDILSGEIYLGVGQPQLWTAGETPRKPQLDQSAAKTKALLVTDLPPYYTNSNVLLISPTGKYKTMKINGNKYHNGLALNMKMQISGGHFGSVMFNLNKRYDKLSFIVGPLDNNRNTAEGQGYLTIQGDGYTIYQKEIRQLDTAEQVVIDVEGVSRLSFHSDQSQWDINAGFAEVTAWPKGMTPESVDVSQPVAADPKLAKLPDVCPLMSNIEPFAILGGLDRDQMLFTGKSDYIGFSMGGVQHSEGMLFTSGASFFHDHIYSSASFDLGGQFDYITFVTGSVGSSNVKDGEINVLADDKILYTVPVHATGMPIKHWVKIDKCRKLTFDNRKGGGTVGVADIVLYRGNIVENDLFTHPKPDCPENIDLLRLTKPYLHYVSGTSEGLCCDGSDIKKYWTLRDGTRINNGFMLKTSVHFSLEHGVLGDDPNAAMAGAVGATAVGSSFVAGGMVGGSMIGSSLAGMAGLMMLAAGGEAEESSVAAFNTYGEYNSVTFTVACISPADSGLLDAGTYTDRQQRILIGADGEVVTELMLNEINDPVTFTVPINGCQQLIFWMPCDNGSGKYIVYNAKLSKAKTKLIRPESSVKSQEKVTLFGWTDVPAPNKWDKPQMTNVGNVNQYFGNVLQLYNGVNSLIHNNEGQPKYEYHTWYLKTSQGLVCKATRIINNGGTNAVRNATGVQAALGANFDPFEVRIPELGTEILREIETLNKLNSLVNSIRVNQATVSISLPQLGLGAIRYGKELGKSKKIVDQCNKVIDTYLKSKKEHFAAIKWLLDNAAIVDGKKSTEYTIFTPLESGEVPPADADIQLVETFKVK